MVIFFDTSSLLKRYVEEKGSNEIDKYFVQENGIWISPITTIEMNAALKRKIIDGSIDSETYTKAVDYWNRDYHRYWVVPYTEELITGAIEIIKSNVVKTLDGIQMSSARLSGADICITSDMKMHQKLELLLNREVVLI